MNYIKYSYNYKNTTINKTINLIMVDGKKSKAESIIINVLTLLEQKYKSNPENIFENAINLIKPILEIRNKKVGGSMFKIPVTIHPQRQMTLAIKGLIDVAKTRGEKTFSLKIFNEILNVLKQQSVLIKKRDEAHKTANANRAFIHYRW